MTTSLIEIPLRQTAQFNQQAQERRAYCDAANSAVADSLSRLNFGTGEDITDDPIVNRALSWVGRATYGDAQCRPGCFDCSGLVAFAVTGRYNRIGTTLTFATNKSAFPWVCSPRPGDIVLVHNTTKQHCGIYYCPGLMIEAKDVGIGVVLCHFDPTCYRYCRYEGA